MKIWNPSDIKVYSNEINAEQFDKKTLIRVWYSQIFIHIIYSIRNYVTLYSDRSRKLISLTY